MSVLEGLTLPPAAILLGSEFLSEDPEAGTVEVAFHPDDRMLNPTGTVQGGIVAAMLDDTMGPALLVATRGELVASTIDMSVSFLRPVKPGRVIGRGRVVRLGRQVAFLEAELCDEAGVVLARATSSAVPVPVKR